MHVSIRAAVFMAEFYGLHGQGEWSSREEQRAFTFQALFHQLSQEDEDRDSSRSQSTLIFHPAIFI